MRKVQPDGIEAVPAQKLPPRVQGLEAEAMWHRQFVLLGAVPVDTLERKRLAIRKQLAVVAHGEVEHWWAERESRLCL